MGESDEGSQTAPQSQGEPYPEPDAKARRWSKHLADRTRHPKNKQVITPAGIFASASQASQAHGFSMAHGSRLARTGKRGWRYFVHGVDAPADVRDLPRGSVKPPVRSNAKGVLTPDGFFVSARAAADHYGISRQAVSQRALRGLHGWSYVNQR